MANSGEYPVQTVDSVAEACDGLPDDAFVLVDSTVLRLYPTIEAHRSCLGVDATEEAKSFDQIGTVLQAMISAGVRRSTVVVAIGGGIVQDVASFCASILYRGIPWTFLPSNLLSQADSCIGSKTSINFRGYKNLLGGFYPPNRVVICQEFLTTLSDADIRSGLGEILHYVVIEGESAFARFQALSGRALSGDRSGLPELIGQSLGIKAKMVEIDEFDRGPRRVFNYGHSFGHAMEAASGYRIPHGIAVAKGIDLANELAVELGLLCREDNERIRKVSQTIHKVESFELKPEEIIAALLRDKKNKPGSYGLILARAIGDIRLEYVDFDGPVERLLQREFAGSGRHQPIG
jgi:3-dehydroquinate synthase